MSCEYCQLVQGKGKGKILYENEQLVVAIKDTQVTPGQITVFPKQHFTIIEQVPDDLVTACAILANKVSIAIFESLGAKGTNVVIQNGTAAGQKRPHFAIEVIPRQEEDGLNFQWPARQLTEDELGYLLEQLTENPEPVIEVVKKKEPVKEQKGKDNYLLKSLRKKA